MKMMLTSQSQQLESVYRAATVVGNICVYASVTETKPIAIIVPVEAALKQLATTLGVEGHSIEDFAHNKKIVAEIHKQMLAVGKKANLAGIELIQGLILSEEEWTTQNVSFLFLFGGGCAFKISGGK